MSGIAERYIEIGNTTLKVAKSNAGGTFDTERYSDVSGMLGALQGVSDVLVAPVARTRSADIVKALQQSVPVVRQLETPLFWNFVADTYDTPDTLGLDRILNLYGLEEDAVVVSCGTAVTVDAVVDGRPFWGAIGAGFGTTGRSLVQSAPDLPIVGIGDLLELPSRTSTASVAFGVFRLLADGIESVVRRIVRTCGSNLRCIVTGGDADILQQLWSIEVRLEKRPDILFTGMRRAEDRLLT